MGVPTLISLEQYLSTSYSPDREYRAGALVERNVGNRSHARLQLALGAYLYRRRKQWQMETFTELRIRVREDWYPIPDVCVYETPAPDDEGPSRLPLLWIEILSPDDRMMDVWDKARDLVAAGVPLVWIVDPTSLESELHTSRGMASVPEKTLRVPDSPIVIPLTEVIDE